MLLFARAKSVPSQKPSLVPTAQPFSVCVGEVWSALLLVLAWWSWDGSPCLLLDFNGYASGEEAESELSESQGHPEDILWPLCILNHWLGAGSEMRCPQRRHLQPVDMSGAKTGPHDQCLSSCLPHTLGW